MSITSYLPTLLCLTWVFLFIVERRVASICGAFAARFDIPEHTAVVFGYLGLLLGALSIIYLLFT